MITPDEIILKPLQSNDFNYLLVMFACSELFFLMLQKIISFIIGIFKTLIDM